MHIGDSGIVTGLKKTVIYLALLLHMLFIIFKFESLRGILFCPDELNSMVLAISFFIRIIYFGISQALVVDDREIFVVERYACRTAFMLYA